MDNIILTGIETSDSIVITGSAIEPQVILTGTIATKGDPGPPGPRGVQGSAGSNGVGVPTGGATGQILTKTSSSDYATAWQSQVVQSYTNATATPVTLGGIVAGSTFTSVPFSTVFDRLLYPFQFPSFTSFTISGQSQNIEVGTTISGSKTFNWATSNSANVQTNSVIVKDATTTIASGIANNGSATLAVSTTQLTTPGNHTWSISATDTQTNMFTNSFVVNWLWRIYSGTSTNTALTASQVQALATASLQGNATTTYSFGTGGYKFICYPVTFSAANQFTDTSTQLTVTMADSTDDASFSNTANGLSFALVSVTNSFSQTVNYRIYRTKYILGGSINIAVT